MRFLLCFLVLFSVIGCASRQIANVKNQNSVETPASITGGSGESIEDAVIISGVKNQSEGMDAEYAHLSSKHGLKNREWRIVGQTIVQDHGKVFDVIEIELTMTKEGRIYYFDVSAFPWKKK